MPKSHESSRSQSCNFQKSHELIVERKEITELIKTENRYRFEEFDTDRTEDSLPFFAPLDLLFNYTCGGVSMLCECGIQDQWIVTN